MPARDAPLVVTLALPDEVQDELDALRRRWFPAGRTAVGAHLTLFHAVPGDLEAQVRTDLAEVAAAGPVALRLTGVTSLGRGAAYVVESPDLVRRHDELQRAWWSHLTRQDQQRLRAHVTVANKVEPAVARATVETLRAGFNPADVEAPGFDLWRYDGGPGPTWRGSPPRPEPSTRAGNGPGRTKPPMPEHGGLRSARDQVRRGPCS